MCMFGSAAVAYFAHLAQISRVRVMPLRCHCDPVERASREDRMTLHAAHDIGWKKIDMCTVALYDYE